MGKSSLSATMFVPHPPCQHVSWRCSIADLSRQEGYHFLLHLPRYPASEALHGLIADQLQWYAYKRDVLSDVLGKDSRETVAMTLLPPVTAPLKLLPSLEDKFQQ
eukprot:Em0670g1a